MIGVAEEELQIIPSPGSAGEIYFSEDGFLLPCVEHGKVIVGRFVDFHQRRVLPAELKPLSSIRFQKGPISINQVSIYKRMCNGTLHGFPF